MNETLEHLLCFCTTLATTRLIYRKLRISKALKRLQGWRLARSLVARKLLTMNTSDRIKTDFQLALQM